METLKPSNQKPLPDNPLATQSSIPLGYTVTTLHSHMNMLEFHTCHTRALYQPSENSLHTSHGTVIVVQHCQQLGVFRLTTKQINIATLGMRLELWCSMGMRLELMCSLGTRLELMCDTSTRTCAQFGYETRTCTVWV